MALLMVALGARPAFAVTYEEIPPALLDRLPEILLKMADPRALAALSLSDIEEFADAYEAGELHFVSEVNVVESSGPVKPELAELILQIPPGAPYIEQRFVRLAKQAYGRGVFSKLRWAVYDNEDGSVRVNLWYAANDSKVWVPLYGVNGISGTSLGVSYRDYRLGDKDRQLEVWGELSEGETEEPEGGVSYSDGTLNGGRNRLSAVASVANQWRRRGSLTPSAASMRQRITELDLSYSWQESSQFGLQSQDYGVSTGLYHQDSFVYSGDPSAGGTAPRSDFNQAANAGYLRVFWNNEQRNLAFAPSAGWDYSVWAERHTGGFDFASVSADLRRYIPARNILGIEPDTVVSRTVQNDAHRLFPTASIALQAQVVVADGDVPYSREVRADLPSVSRGLEHDHHLGTKLLALRGEYRFALDSNRRHEAFVFTDHVLYGERLDKLEADDTFGLGATIRLPVYGGFRLGGYYGWSFDNSDSNFGIAIGYMF